MTLLASGTLEFRPRTNGLLDNNVYPAVNMDSFSKCSRDTFFFPDVAHCRDAIGIFKGLDVLFVDSGFANTYNQVVSGERNTS